MSNHDKNTSALPSPGWTKRAAFLFALCSFLLFSCSGGKKSYVIGLSQCSQDNWREKLNTELRDATYLYDNVKLRIVSADDDDKQQAAQINAFTQEGIDLLIVSPNQMNTVTPAIDRAYDQGIPVILFDRKSGSDKYSAFIGADNVKIGHTIGEYVATRLKGQGTVAEIRGLEGSSPAIERHEGFVAALKRYPGIRLVAVEHGNWSQESGRKAAGKMFSEGIVPDYIFAQNDRMAHGAWQAAKRTGLEKKIRFVGIDALPGEGEGISLVKDGVLDASYIYPTRGDIVMQLAMDILEGNPHERDNYMKAALVTRDNAETMLMQAEEMSHLSTQMEKLHGRIDFFFTQYSHQRIYSILCLIIMVLAIVTCVAFYRMMLAKKRAEQMATEAKLSFFTDMSHDLRTPLTLIADPVERMLDDENLTPRQRQTLGIVRRNAASLLKLVGEILDLRKIQSGKMEAQVTEFDLADMVRRWVEDFKPLADSARVTLEVVAGERLPVKADLNKVERICYNLVSNALKYNRQGGKVTVTVRANDGNAVISVADTGVGIPKEVISRVFDKFYRVSDGGSGTGVGLAVVKAFTELQGGKVSVKSVEGEGSEFTVELPVLSPDGSATAGEGSTVPVADTRLARPEETEETGTEPEDEGEDPGQLSAGRPIVLVVDDNLEVRRYIAQLMGDTYDVRLATNGKEGLEMALGIVPDLIVCDVMMPVMDGLEMCRRVKTETATSHVPVILLTANAEESQRAEGYDCGADAYITKPFSSKVLLSRARNLLENRKRLKYAYTAMEAERQPDSDDDADSVFMGRFRQTVDERLGDSSLSVETISAALGLSRVQMYRKVKQLTGQTPVELIRVTRLKKAEHLLRTTRMAISEIAYDVGFSSPSYFSKCFKDQFGVQPGELRE